METKRQNERGIQVLLQSMMQNSREKVMDQSKQILSWYITLIFCLSLSPSVSLCLSLSLSLSPILIGPNLYICENDMLASPPMCLNATLVFGKAGMLCPRCGGASSVCQCCRTGCGVRTCQQPFSEERENVYNIDVYIFVYNNICLSIHMCGMCLLIAVVGFTSRSSLYSLNSKASLYIFVFLFHSCFNGYIV